MIFSWLDRQIWSLPDVHNICAIFHIPVYGSYDVHNYKTQNIKLKYRVALIEQNQQLIIRGVEFW